MKTYILKIYGSVQGVGFRPWVAKIAKNIDLRGIVYNDLNSVVIEINTDSKKLDVFKKILLSDANPGDVSNIEIQETDRKNYKNYKNFQIIPIQKNKSKILDNTANNYPVIPDRSICTNCLNELFDKNNKRYKYPFITCASCGPRFSILKSLPFDRNNTSMGDFELCASCKAEYNDINNSRYHAQTISCPECGPKLEFINLFSLSSTAHKVASSQSQNSLILQQAISQTIQAIKNGRIIAIKGIGGYHLACDATNDNAVRDLRKLKNRKFKPFAVMIKDINTIKLYCEISDKEQEILESPSAPIVLLTRKKTNNANKDIAISHDTAPGLSELGVFLPYTGLHHILLNKINKPLVMTSANLSGYPIAFNLSDVLEQFNGKIFGVLTNNRDIFFPCDDSVIRVINNKLLFIRRARGYSLLIGNKDNKKTELRKNNQSDKICIAVGAQMKNTIAIQKNNIIYLSPYIGDMNSLEQLKRFEYYHNHLLNLLQIENNKEYISDIHPDYELNKYFDNNKINTKKIQHHLAHVCASLSEYPDLNNVLILTWDGTGLGLDNTIWGGEGFVYNNHYLTRVSTLKPFKLLGGEQAIREPKRVALSLLFHTYGTSLKDLPAYWQDWIATNFTKSEFSNYNKIWQNNINTVLTSSMGRLFDGVASLLNICHNNDFDGQAPMLLESVASSIDIKTSIEPLQDFLEYTTDSSEQLLTLNWSGIIHLIVELISINKKNAYIARLVHVIIANTVVDLIKKLKLNNLILTGGVFQNKLISELIICKSQEGNITVHQPINIPVNDSGLSVGQLYIGNLER